MDGKRLLRRIRLQNILSYGPEARDLELLPLNVLIGPNGSGKSNLIESISLLKACAAILSEPIRDGGGILEWVSKGASPDPTVLPSVSCTSPIRENQKLSVIISGLFLRDINSRFTPRPLAAKASLALIRRPASSTT